jgi:hypothetical protein
VDNRQRGKASDDVNVGWQAREKRSLTAGIQVLAMLPGHVAARSRRISQCLEAVEASSVWRQKQWTDQADIPVDLRL